MNTPDWNSANQQHLTAAVDIVRRLLQAGDSAPVASKKPDMPERLESIAEKMPSPPALDQLEKIFNLTVFERNLLVLCAAVALDTGFPALCAARQDNPLQRFPTFALALAILPEAHWDALLPTSPLRHWRLIDVATTNNSTPLTEAALVIDERILHYLRGLNYLDICLDGLLFSVRHVDDLVPSQLELAENLKIHWHKIWHQAHPVVQLFSSDHYTRQSIACYASNSLGQNLWCLNASSLPSSVGEREALIRLWGREALLTQSALLLDCNNSSKIEQTVIDFIERASFPLIVSGNERVDTNSPVVTFEVSASKLEEQQVVWRQTLPATKLNGELNTLIGQFNLTPKQIDSVGARFKASHQEPFASREAELAALWQVCRIEARPRLEMLAQRIECAAQWEDLVLPDEQQQILLQIKAQVGQRFKVYEQWGFASKDRRGLGISALFAGPSGTGKTLAAEVIANTLQLDLYRIDLSQVVSKYIGETEKNLRRIFDAAESGGAVLLFDECDALFGKRSEVKDSHDRYANIEVSYLLQRMEAYRGLAVLTTNMSQAIDQAFLRRIRFVIQFSFPDLLQRTEIWRRVFPTDLPKADLSPELLARLNVTGGNIRNIALGAAFLAAEEDSSVGMDHLLRSAKTECLKIEKPLSNAEVQGWV